VWKEDIFKLTIGNESFHRISNDNGVGVVNFATSQNVYIYKTLRFKVQLFQGYKSEIGPINTKSVVQHVIRYQVLLAAYFARTAYVTLGTASFNIFDAVM
jgi:hypothetical protein